MPTMSSPSGPNQPELLDRVYTHVLKRGPAACPEQRRRAVRSPADRLAILQTSAPLSSADTLPAEIGCRRPQPISVTASVTPPTPGSFPSRGFAQNLPNRRKEIGYTRLQP